MLLTSEAVRADGSSTTLICYGPETHHLILTCIKEVPYILFFQPVVLEERKDFHILRYSIIYCFNSPTFAGSNFNS